MKFLGMAGPGARVGAAGILALGLVALTPQLAFSQATPLVKVAATLDAFDRSLAEAVAEDKAVAAYYRDTDYAPIWTGAGQEARRGALLAVLADAGLHGLPVGRYDPQSLIAAFGAARTEGDRGRLEAMMTLAMLDYARDVQSGALNPLRIDSGMVREVPLRDRRANLETFVKSDPSVFLHSLPPRTQVYAQLMRARMELEKVLAGNGWGPQVSARSLQPGAKGAEFLELRNRLTAMGYLPRSVTATYDSDVIHAVETYQLDQGLPVTGSADATTIAQLNTDPQERLKSVIVALERERWMNIERGARHIWVNLTDFSAKIMDHGRVTFSTRSVVGKNEGDRRTPEFSDVMEYMVINPTWNVPRSITTKEYLPMMKRNPNAVGHLKILDSRGRVVPRSAINFANYTERTFPYSMKQPPSDGNALGLVKFMFPNQYNIYLHDTPSKSLFKEDVRAYSHGCIRLADPFDFAYALLAVQSDDPVGEFQRHLNTGRETSVRLAEPVPVHLVYFTAYPTPKGRMGYRRDVYGRDAAIFDALEKAGVVLGGQQS